MEFLRLFLRCYFVETSGGVGKSLLSHVNDTLTDCQTTMLFNKSNCYFLFFKYWKGCALAEPGGPWRSTFALG